MLELKNVSLSYGDLRVLRDVSLRLAPGERIAVMGPSGCGKTSLLRVIAGLQSPDSGTVERTAQRLSFVFQEPRLLPWLTAAENVRLVLPDAHHGEAPCRDISDGLTQTTISRCGSVWNTIHQSASDSAYSASISACWQAATEKGII